jgi:acyl-CoA thioester hydrolase
MPLKHTRSFRVRQYECDVNGHVRCANYLRYMQETAFDASAAAGYDHYKYKSMSQIWLIRETEIEYIRPLQYGDHFKIDTWVQDFRRVSSRRRYEFYNSKTNAPAAVAHTDWAYIDTQTNRPTLIPDEIAGAFFPEGLPESFAARQPFPSPPAPPQLVYKMRLKVGWQDIDLLRHVNNAVYIDYMNECIMQLMAAFGWTSKRQTEAGFGINARRIRIKYSQQAIFNDELEISTWAYDMQRSTGIRYYEIRRVENDALIAQINTQDVCRDLTTGKTIRIPPDFLESFKANIA